MGVGVGAGVGIAVGKGREIFTSGGVCTGVGIAVKGSGGFHSGCGVGVLVSLFVKGVWVGSGVGFSLAWSGEFPLEPEIRSGIGAVVQVVDVWIPWWEGSLPENGLF